MAPDGLRASRQYSPDVDSDTDDHDAAALRPSVSRSVAAEPDLAFLRTRSEQPQFTLRALVVGLLIGILIAMVVNWFLASSALDYAISVAGVLIFTGLIAYDTQKLKRIAAGVEYGSETGRKLAVLGATSLYLDFVNLFLFLLRLLGRRD